VLLLTSVAPLPLLHRERDAGAHWDRAGADAVARSASQDAPTLTALGCPPEADLVVTTANVQTRVNEVGFYVAALA
jgi:hypothetical protein